MKLVRFGKAGEERPGMIDANGDLRDLSGVIDDIAGKTLAPESLAKIRATRSGDPAASRPAPRVSVRVSAGSASSWPSA